MVQDYEGLRQDKPVTLKINCRDCIYFKNAAFYSDGKSPQPCHALGRQPQQIPCPAFQINPYDIDFNNNAVSLFSRLSMLTPPDKLPLLAALLVQETATRNNGYFFGQNVYVRIYPDDFISNWATAKILFASSSGVYIQGKRGFRALVKHESVLSEKKWEQHERYLRSVGRSVDPQINSYKFNGHPTDLLDKANVPTIDQFNGQGALPNGNGNGINAETETPVRRRGRGRPRKNENATVVLGR